MFGALVTVSRLILIQLYTTWIVFILLYSRYLIDSFLLNIFLFKTENIKLRAMPALAADQVSLEEVLVVRGEPLTEQHIWSLLCLSSEALQDVFLSGVYKIFTTCILR